MFGQPSNVKACLARALFLALLTSLSACASPGRSWSQVRDFACQLQDLNLAQVQRSGFDLLITDYSWDGSAAQRLTRAQVQDLQTGRYGRRRLVLAYLSVGEAESYRFYWQPWFRTGQPAWLGRANPQWPDNYPVRYWDPHWKAILRTYLRQILAAGFDGLYLDLVDAYEYHEGLGRPQARAQMVNLVQELALRARRQAGPDFGVFVQNADELLVNPAYLACLTGVAREETFYGYNGDNRASPAAWTRQVCERLRHARQAGKLVLSLDYSNRPDQIRSAHQRARALGFLEYVAPRRLDRLATVPGLQPKIK